MKKIANEKQLIDVNACLHDMCKRCNIENEGCPCEPADCFIYNVLENSTTVDAVEVIHSTWTFNKDGSGTCQNCHRTTKNAWDYDSWMRYCPNCGAKMDGDKHE